MSRRLLIVLALAFAAGMALWRFLPDPPPGPRTARTSGVETADEAPTLEGMGGRPGDRPDEFPERLEELEAADDETASWVTIHIVDATTGSPIAGAEYGRMVLSSAWESTHGDVGRSDHEGAIRVPVRRFTPVTYVRRDGYVFVQHMTQGIPPEIRLTRAPPLVGRVVDASSGRAVAGARVLATWTDANRAMADRFQKTDGEGRFTVAGIPPDRRVDLIVARDGYATVRRGAVGAGEIEVRLGDGAEVFGRVLRPDGSPASEAEVYVVEAGDPSPLDESNFGTPLGGLWPTHAVTDAEGRYRIRGIPIPVGVVIHARALERQKGRSGMLTLDAAKTRATVDVTVQATGTLVVRCVDASTRARVPPGQLSCALDASWGRAAQHQRLRVGWGEGDGSFLEAITPGRHVVYVSPSRHLAPRPHKVDIRPGETIEVEIELEPGLTVEGRVVDETGAPIEAYVFFSTEWGGVTQSANAHPSHDGRFTLHGVPPIAGTLQVFATDDGERFWNDREISGDLGDLVLPRGPVLLVALPVELYDVPIFGYTNSATNCSETGETYLEEGSVRIGGLVPGEPTLVVLQAEGHGAALVIRDVILEAGEIREIGPFTFPSSVAVEGRVLDVDGMPVSGAEIQSVEDWNEGRTRTDDAGRFRLPGLAPEPTTLWIETGPSTVAFVPVDVAADMPPQTIQLEAPGRLRVRLVDAQGRPVPKSPVNVALLDARGRTDWDRRTIPRTDSLGRLHLDLYPGRYALIPHNNTRLETIGGAPTVTITSGETTSLDIRVRPTR